MDLVRCDTYVSVNRKVRALVYLFLCVCASHTYDDAVHPADILRLAHLR